MKLICDCSSCSQKKILQISLGLIECRYLRLSRLLTILINLNTNFIKYKLSLLNSVSH